MRCVKRITVFFIIGVMILLQPAAYGGEPVNPSEPIDIQIRLLNAEADIDGRFIADSSVPVEVQLFVRNELQGVAAVYYSVRSEYTEESHKVVFQEQRESETMALEVENYAEASLDSADAWSLEEAGDHQIITACRQLSVPVSQKMTIALGFTDLQGRYYGIRNNYQVVPPAFEEDPEVADDYETGEVPDMQETSEGEGRREIESPEAAEEWEEMERPDTEEVIAETELPEPAEEWEEMERPDTGEAIAETELPEAAEEWAEMERPDIEEAIAEKELPEAAEDWEEAEGVKAEEQFVETERPEILAEPEGTDEPVVQIAVIPAETAPVLELLPSYEIEYHEERERFYDFPEEDFDWYTVDSLPEWEEPVVPDGFEELEIMEPEEGDDGEEESSKGNEEDPGVVQTADAAPEQTKKAEIGQPTGSTFDLSALSKVNGKYLQQVDDLVIYEENAVKIPEDAVRITVSRNGELFDLEKDVDYSFQLVGNTAHKKIYKYKIHSDVFQEDGVYRVYLTSTDGAGNCSQNEEQDAPIQFGIDNTSPLILALEPQEEMSGKAEKQLRIRDDQHLSNVDIYVGEEKIDYKTEGDIYRFQVPELEEETEIKVVARDAAGNTYERMIPHTVKTGALSVKGGSTARIWLLPLLAVLGGIPAVVLYRKRHSRKSSHTGRSR